ncbi:MAG TPA: prepilin-type N-terminal cleavage/methylation domain-containing protein [Fimbriimonas sp.]|nr:prepilin-type N-terminal cleavage/methylation domain-containing protein [Fimbriimonas sp.]
MKRRHAGFTLVATLIVIAIIAIATVVYINGTGDTKPTPKADGRGKTVLGNVKASAEDTQCQSNISQARQLLQVAKASDEEFMPTTVAEIPGAASVSKCPVGKEDYTLGTDGTMKCPHPGHGKY